MWLTRFLSLIGAGAVLGWTGVAIAFQNEPTGMDDIEFMMTISRVRELHPEMELVSPKPKTDAEKLQAERLAVSVYSLSSRDLGGMKCDVNLKFFMKKLSHIEFRCPDKERTGAYMRERYGEPTTTSKRGWYWVGKESIATYSIRNGYALIGNKQANDALQGHLLSIYLSNPPAPAQKAATGAAEGAVKQ